MNKEDFINYMRTLINEFEELQKDEQTFQAFLEENDCDSSANMSLTDWFNVLENFHGLRDAIEILNRNHIEDDMDGDHQSALASAGHGLDEDYGSYSEHF